MPLLKSVSIAAMLGVGLLTYRYFTSCRGVPRQIAAGITLATVLTPGFVFLATSTVMADCVFTLGQLLVIVVVDRSARVDNEAAGRRYVLFAALIAAATMLVRTTGVAVIVAIILYLLNERRWQRALLFGAVTLACLMPWTIYARIHEPTTAQRLEHGGSIAYAYSDSMRMKRAADPASGRATLRDLTVRVGGNVFNVLGRDISGVFIPTFLRGADESGEEVVALGGTLGLTAGSMGNAGATMFISFLISAVVLIGYVSAARTRLSAVELLVPISIAMIVVVPFWTFRYVLPLAPFLFFYFLEGLRVTRDVDRAPCAQRGARSVVAGEDRDLCASSVSTPTITRDTFSTRAPSMARTDRLGRRFSRNRRGAGLDDSRTSPKTARSRRRIRLWCFLKQVEKALAIDDYAGNRAKWKALGVQVCRLSPPGDAARGAGWLVHAAVSVREAEAVGD